MEMRHVHRKEELRDIRVIADSGEGHVMVILHDGTQFDVQGSAELILPHFQGEAAWA